MISDECSLRSRGMQRSCELAFWLIGILDKIFKIKDKISKKQRQKGLNSSPVSQVLL
jgi:hypothetical protein